MATQMAETAPLASGGKPRKRARAGFYFWTSLLLLASVLIGFTPTLYLRPLFTQAEPSLPLDLYLHGAVLTAWYICS